MCFFVVVVLLLFFFVVFFWGGLWSVFITLFFIIILLLLFFYTREGQIMAAPCCVIGSMLKNRHCKLSFLRQNKHDSCLHGYWHARQKDSLFIWIEPPQWIRSLIGFLSSQPLLHDCTIKRSCHVLFCL